MALLVLVASNSTNVLVVNLICISVELDEQKTLLAAI